MGRTTQLVTRPQYVLGQMALVMLKQCKEMVSCLLQRNEGLNVLPVLLRSSQRDPGFGSHDSLPAGGLESAASWETGGPFSAGWAVSHSTVPFHQVWKKLPSLQYSNKYVVCQSIFHSSPTALPEWFLKENININLFLK